MVEIILHVFVNNLIMNICPICVQTLALDSLVLLSSVRALGFQRSVSNLVVLFAHRIAIVVGLRDVRNGVIQIAVESSSTCLGKECGELFVFAATIHIIITDNAIHFLSFVKLGDVGQFQSFNFQLNFCRLHDIAILLKILVKLGKFVINSLEASFNP